MHLIAWLVFYLHSGLSGCNVWEITCTSRCVPLESGLGNQLWIIGLLLPRLGAQTYVTCNQTWTVLSETQTLPNECIVVTSDFATKGAVTERGAHLKLQHGYSRSNRTNTIAHWNQAFSNCRNNRGQVNRTWMYSQTRLVRVFCVQSSGTSTYRGCFD